MTLARMAADFVEPRSVWTVYPPGDISNGCMTAEHRCAWPSPWFHAENVAYQAACVTGNQAQEFQWQRQELVRMILGWKRWDEDCQDWQRCLEERWIPRVQAELTYAPFKIPTYIQRLRREWMPWRRAE